MNSMNQISENTVRKPASSLLIAGKANDFILGESINASDSYQVVLNKIAIFLSKARVAKANTNPVGEIINNLNGTYNQLVLDLSFAKLGNSATNHGPTINFGSNTVLVYDFIADLKKKFSSTYPEFQGDLFVMLKNHLRLYADPSKPRILFTTKEDIGW
jgi:hypothetical protein